MSCPAAGSVSHSNGPVLLMASGARTSRSSWRPADLHPGSVPCRLCSHMKISETQIYVRALRAASSRAPSTLPGSACLLLAPQQELLTVSPKAFGWDGCETGRGGGMDCTAAERWLELKEGRLLNPQHSQNSALSDGPPSSLLCLNIPNVRKEGDEVR